MAAPSPFSAVGVLTKQPPKAAPAVPTGPPHPALQAVGFNGSITDFNDRVAAVAAAHQQTFGTKPTPGVAFDVARSPIPNQQIPGLFRNLPSMQTQVRAKSVAPQVPDPILTPKDFADQIRAAGKAGALNKFLDDHADAIKVFAKDRKWAPRIARAIFDASDERKQAEVDTAAAFDPGIASKVAGKVALGGSQVGSALAHSPGGVYQTGKAVTLDTWDLAHGDVTPERTIAIAHAMAHQIARDVTHPGENPGYLFLDVLGLASLGAGSVARVAAGGRALGEGAGVAAAAKAVATRPRGGTYAIGREGAQENALLSDNPLVAAAQKVRLARKQKRLDLTTVNGERQPAGLLSILQPQSAKDFLDEHFSHEAKVGREADARRRTEHIVNMTLARELDHVAGGSVAQARAFARMPKQLRGSLTRGEQKAIQVVSWGVTPRDQIAAHLGFIEEHIGDAKAHRRQIADLKLAEKVLNDPAARGRFKKALILTQHEAAKAQATKIDDLGLSPLTSEERIGKPARALGLEAKAQTYPATGTVEPFYTKLELRGKQKRPPSDRVGFYPTKPGPFGIPLPRDLPELTHEFTGAAIRSGNFRIDATHLTTESYARAVRAVSVLTEHARLWKSATDTPKTRFDIPIRDSQKIPDRLREILGTMDEGVFTDKEAAQLPADMRSLIEELYPPIDRLSREPIEGVKWVDGRTIGSANEIPTRPGAVAKAASIINEPVRDLTLFLRPAYILNAVGNSAMLVFHQGFAAVPSMARALNAKAVLGEDTVRTIDALMGQGKSKSYTTAIAPRLGQVLAQAWSVVTDTAFRRASFLYEARRLGYKTPEQITQLVRDGGKDLVEAKRRGNKAMVEFDNLTPFEKNVLRHVIFVYPWVSRSTVWSLRSVMEHPVRTDILAQLGEQEENTDPIFKRAPEWFKRIGYFPVGWNNDGTPKLVNPTSINTFSTLSDIGSVLGAGLGGTKYAAFSDMLGPAGQFLEHAVSGKDEYGNNYPDKQWLRAAGDVLTGIPQIVAMQRGNKKNPDQKPVDPTRRESIVSAFNSNLKRTVFSPGWLNGYGSLLAGGFSPRSADLQALEARYWRDATPEQRHANELVLLDKALGIQGGLLKEHVPDRVRQAVTVGSDIDFVYKQFAHDHGRPPTTKERAGLLIDHLDSKGLLPSGEADKYRKQLDKMVAETDINHLRSAVFGKYGGGDALNQWDSDVRLVASFDQAVFKQKTASLYKQGLVKSPVPNASQEDLYAYGRKYLQFTRKVVGIKDAIKAGTATSADLRAFEDANDKPVSVRPPMTTIPGRHPGMVAQGNIDIANRPVAHNKDGSISTVRSIDIDEDGAVVSIPTVVNGRVVSDSAAIEHYKKTGEFLGKFSTQAAADAYDVALHNQQAKMYLHPSPPLPSFTRTAWSYLPEKDQRQAVRSAAVATWSSLTNFEKTLLGHPTDAKVTAGWAKLAEVVKSQRAELARKGEVFPAGYRRILARYVEKNFNAPGLVADFDFANKPLYERLGQVAPVQKSPHADQWRQVLDVAARYAKYLKSPDYEKKQVRQMWRDYVTGTLQPWVAGDPAFAAEVNGYGRNLLEKLLS